MLFSYAYAGSVEVGAAVVVVGLIVVVAVLVVRVGTRVTGLIQLERLHPPTPQVHRHIQATEGAMGPQTLANSKFQTS